MWQLALRALPMIARVAGGARAAGAATGAAEAATGGSRLMNFAEGAGKIAQAMPNKSQAPQQQSVNKQPNNYHETTPYSY